MTLNERRIDSQPRWLAASAAGAAEAGEKVFVYGTLRRGQGNHEYFLGGADYIGEALTLPKYTMINMGHFPGCIHGGKTAIKGEVYQITSSQLRELDRLESHPTFYRRYATKLQGGMIAWMYVLGSEWTTEVNPKSMIEDGDWLNRFQKKN